MPVVTTTPFLSVFPELDGIEMGMTIRPEFKTNIFEALSGKETRIAFRQNPKYSIKFSFEFLIQNRDEKQLTELMKFFLDRKGMYEAFLFTNPLDNYVEDEIIGYGDAVQTVYPFSRSLVSVDYSTYTELTPYVNTNQPINVYSEGVLKTQGTHYNLNSTGGITFINPPTAGETISWTGYFYYKVRFGSDGYDFNKLLKELYECRDIELIGSPGDFV